MGEDFNRRAALMYAEQAPDVDIIITTALIAGRPAPRLITEEMVASMESGSVIVDMAAAQRGNVAGSVADELVVTRNGVSIIGYSVMSCRPAAQLIAEEMGASMKSGSLIVDMASARGGNGAGSVADELVVTPRGVSFIGYTDLAGRLPAQACQLYGQNLVSLLTLLTP